jgi:hypothetical protein
MTIEKALDIIDFYVVGSLQHDDEQVQEAMATIEALCDRLEKQAIALAQRRVMGEKAGDA